MGVSESPYSGPIRILGEQAWEWQNAGMSRDASDHSKLYVTGEFTDNLGSADREKDKAFIDGIVTGKFHNQAAAGAQSALEAMLAWMAAYQGREVTWKELLRSDEEYDLAIDLNQFS